MMVLQRVLLICLLSVAALVPRSFAAVDTLAPYLSEPAARRAQKVFKQPEFSAPLPGILARRKDSALIAKVRDWAAIQQQRVSDVPLGQLTRSAAQMQAFPNWLTTRRRVEAAFSFTDAPDDILAWFAVTGPVTGRGKLLRADALIRSGLDAPEQSASLRAAWGTAWLDYTDEDIVMGRYQDRFSAADHIARAKFMVAYEGYSSARRMLRRLPADDRKLLRARLALRAFEAGVDAAIAAVPQHYKADPALILDRAYWRRQKGKEDSAIALLQTDLNAMALQRPERLWRERHFWARRRLRKGDYQTAYTLAARHNLKVTGNASQKVRVAYAEAEWTAGWIALRFLNQPAQALVHFKAMHGAVSTPVSRTRGAYWAGRALAALGEAVEAKNWYQRAAAYPHRYYGMLAANALGERPEPAQLTINAVAPMNAKQAYRIFLNTELVQAARLLKDAQRNDLVGDFLSQIALTQQTPEQVYLMSRFGAELGRPDLPLKVAKRLETRGIIYADAGYPSIQLPKSLRGKAALIHAIARQESAFNPTVVSRAGARGLMQLMPATAKRVAREKRMPYRYAELTQDPVYNMTLSSHYLDFLSAEFNAINPLMIAAYNAGENAVSRWIKTYGNPHDPTVDAVDWVELIPYSETRNYTQRVLEALIIYQPRFSPDDERSLSALLAGEGPAGG